MSWKTIKEILEIFIISIIVCIVFVSAIFGGIYIDEKLSNRVESDTLEEEIDCSEIFNEEYKDFNNIPEKYKDCRIIPTIREIQELDSWQQCDKDRTQYRQIIEALKEQL